MHSLLLSLFHIYREESNFPVRWNLRDHMFCISQQGLCSDGMDVSDQKIALAQLQEISGIKEQNSGGRSSLSRAPGNEVSLHGRRARDHGILRGTARDPPSLGHHFTPPNTARSGL